MITTAGEHGLGSPRQPLELLGFLRGEQLDLLRLRLLERAGASGRVGGLRARVVRREKERDDG